MSQPRSFYNIYPYLGGATFCTLDKLRWGASHDASSLKHALDLKAFPPCIIITVIIVILVISQTTYLT